MAVPEGAAWRFATLRAWSAGDMTQIQQAVAAAKDVDVGRADPQQPPVAFDADDEVRTVVRRVLDASGTSAEAVPGEAAAPAFVRRKVERIMQEITLTGALNEEQRARLMEIAGKCPVHRTITGDLEIIDVEKTAEPEEHPMM